MQEHPLEKALRERLERLIKDQSFQAAPPLVNNIYASGMPQTVSEALSAGGEPAMSPEDLDYLVEIEKRDVFSPEADKPVGWNKKVHRYTQQKKQSDRGYMPK